MKNILHILSLQFIVLSSSLTCGSIDNDENYSLSTEEHKEAFEETTLSETPASSIKETGELEPKGHMVNFQQVPMRELIRFISRIAEVNFLAPDELVNFEVNFVSGKPSSNEEILKALIYLLKQHNLEVKIDGEYYIVRKKTEKSKKPPVKKEPEVEKVAEKSAEPEEEKVDPRPAIEEVAPPKEPDLLPEVKKQGKFHLYKLQYHQGSEILALLKASAGDMLASSAGNTEMAQAIQSMQWMESTNSLFFSGDISIISNICNLIKQLDTPLKQALIEVLVIETSFNNSLDFGLKLSANSKFKNYLATSAENNPPSNKTLAFSQGMQQINADGSPSPLNIPTGGGIDLGIIGDIIFHKSRSFLSLGSLVSALQADNNFSIVFNQKILTQENKPSLIFVGDNIPFAGSVIQTTGHSQQTTSNIDYRDIGVTLKITPLIGENDIVSLEISEEISEAFDHPIHKTNQLSGIKTSKTNMLTNVHVPDNHFLILSGMSKNTKSRATAGPPCLGGIPLLSSLLTKKETRREKSNIMVFVKPHIVHNLRRFQDFSKEQKENALSTGSDKTYTHSEK